MLDIKYRLVACLDFLKRVLSLTTLNKNELQGFISPLTKFRFYPNTIISVPFLFGRTIRGVSYNKNFMLDPYARLCRDISDNVEKNILYENIYKEFGAEKKMNAGNLISSKNNTALDKYPYWSIVMPWENQTIDDKYKNYPGEFFKNRSSRNMQFKNNNRSSILDAMHSIDLARNKADQMINLYKSICKKGLIEASNKPKINILINGREWRWFMGASGNHRSYIMSYLGYNFFTARVGNIIDKKDIKKWHNVANGFYTIEEAEEIFDNYFDGNKIIRGII